MTELQEKAEAQVKQIVGQTIGDDQLIQEGKDQQHSADEAGPAASSDSEKEEASHAQRPGRRNDRRKETP